MDTAEGAVKIVAVVNQKGGVAKTTTVANLGACLAECGLRVLLVDMDPQANLTMGLRGEGHDRLYGLPETLLDPAAAPLAGIVRQVTPRLYLAPGHVGMARCASALERRHRPAYQLRDALTPLVHARAFDWVLLDCPPSLGVLTQNAVVAATHLLVPTGPAMYAFAGMDTLNTMVADLARDYRFQAQLLGILLTAVERGTRMHRAITTVIRERFGHRVFETVIYKNIRLAEAEIEGKPIVQFDTRASGAQSYRALAAEVLQRVREREAEEALPQAAR